MNCIHGCSHFPPCLPVCQPGCREVGEGAKICYKRLPSFASYSIFYLAIYPRLANTIHLSSLASVVRLTPISSCTLARTLSLRLFRQSFGSKSAFYLSEKGEIIGNRGQRGGYQLCDARDQPRPPYYRLMAGPDLCSNQPRMNIKRARARDTTN